LNGRTDDTVTKTEGIEIVCYVFFRGVGGVTFSVFIGKIVEVGVS
jgi:hypothetical protein